MRKTWLLIVLLLALGIVGAFTLGPLASDDTDPATPVGSPPPAVDELADAGESRDLERGERTGTSTTPHVPARDDVAQRNQDPADVVGTTRRTPVESGIDAAPPRIVGRLRDPGGNVSQEVRVTWVLVAEAATSPEGREGLPEPTWVRPEEAGAFSLPVPQNQDLALVIDSERHLAHRLEPLRLDEGQRLLDVGVITLERAFPIAGVVSGASGGPLADVTVEARPYAKDDLYAPGRYAGERWTIRTNDQGAFQFGRMADTGYNLLFSGEGLAPVTEVGVRAGRDDVRVTMQRVGSISGHVYRPDGTPARSFAVHVQRRPAGYESTERVRRVFDAGDGSFAIAELPPGTYDLHVESSDHPAATVEAIDLPAGTDRQGVDVHLRGGGTIRGRVVTAGSGEPIAGADVISTRDVPPAGYGDAWDALSSLPGRTAFLTKTDADGFFVLAAASVGTHRLVARADGFAPGVRDGVTVVEAKTTEEIVIELSQGGTIRGRALGVGGAPVEGRYVIAIPWAEAMGRKKLLYRLTTTNERGEFAIENVAPGGYVASLVGRSAKDTLTRSCSVKEGEASEVLFTVEGYGIEVFGTLFDAAGAVVPGRTVMFLCLESLDVQFLSAPTDEQGVYRLSGLTKGRHVVYLQDVTGRSMRLVDYFDLAESEEPVRHDVHLSSAVIRGEVRLRETGQPIADALVNLLIRGDDGQFFYAGTQHTNASGVYRFDQLHPETYRVVASVEGLGQEGTDAITIGNAEEHELPTLFLEPGGRARFTITDLAGLPKAGAYLDALDPAGRVVLLNEYASSSPEGMLETVGLRPGSYTLRVFVNVTGEPEAFPFEVRAGELLDYTFQLRR